MPVKKLLSSLTLLLLFCAACTLETSLEPSSQDSAFPAQASSTEIPSSSPTPEPPIPSGYISPHPWDRLEAFLSDVSTTNRISPNPIPEASIYHISLNLPGNLSAPLTGRQAVRYLNREGILLEEIYFRLFPNYHGGKLEVKNLQVDGEGAVTQLENQDTALRVLLNAPLHPGESLIITMEYSLQLPVDMGGNYGLLGYFDDILTLDTFYPIIPAHDSEGWYTHFPYRNGDATYQDTSYYLVEVSAPKAFLLAATGSEISRKDSGGRRQIIYAAGPARDFFLAGSLDFTVVSKEIDGIWVNSYARPEHKTHQENALNYAEKSLKTFNNLFGPYPYAEFDVVSTPLLALGIEYPGITGIQKDLFKEDDDKSNLVLLEAVIAHEVGHQWFYNVVGNDQQNQPWLDESLTQYITYLYFVNTNQISIANGIVSNWESRLSRVEDKKKAIGLPADRYEGPEYSGIVYGRGPLFFLALEETLGQETVISAIRQYYQDNQWGIADGETLQNSLEVACGCDLSGYFEEWIYIGNPGTN